MKDHFDFIVLIFFLFLLSLGANIYLIQTLWEMDELVLELTADGAEHGVGNN